MNSDPKQYRNYAKQCTEMARKARSAEHKELLTYLANTWLRLAMEVEGSRTLLEGYPPTAFEGYQPTAPLREN